MNRIRKDATTGRFVKHTTPNLCAIKNCEKRVAGRGYCSAHYTRLIRYGDPLFRKKAANGEGSMTCNGYKTVYVDGRQMLLHRHIMEVHLGRALTPGEIVHHIDGDKTNNDISNLSLLDRSTHISQHPEVLDFLKFGPSARRRTKVNPN